jgi:hypothetical protein
MSIDITVEGGKSKRLLTAGKYCESDIVVTATGGGVDLPALSNPATAGDLMAGKQMINGEGEAVDGTFTLETEMTEQDSLIAQIQTALHGKASGGGEPVIEPLEVIENGTYTAPDGVHGYSPVVVNVAASGGDSEEAVASLLDNTMTELSNSIVTSLRTRACQGCNKLVNVNLPNVISLGSYAFYQCSGLVTAKLPKLISVSTQAFYSCTKLQHADCGLLGNIPAQTFNACAALTELILRKTGSICTLSNVNGVNNSPIGKGTGYVYVPASLVDSYKAATNWSTFAAQFRAIEDYPEICG